MTTRCVGVKSHSPVVHTSHAHHIWPLGMGGPDTDANKVDVCPNLHAGTHQLIRITGLRYDGETPWWIRRHFPYEARELAMQGWIAWHDAGRPVPRENWMWQGATVAVDIMSLSNLMKILREVKG